MRPSASRAARSSGTTSAATPVRCACTAEPPSSDRVTRTPVNSSTESGPVTYANASSVITTWSKSPSASAGPETHAPVTASRVGTTPDTRTSSRASRPQACSAATPSRSSAPDVSSSPTSGICSSPARRTARSTVALPLIPIAPWCLPPATRNATTRRPPISVISADAAASAHAWRGVGFTKRAPTPTSRCGRRTRTSSRGPGPDRLRARSR